MKIDKSSVLVMLSALALTHCSSPKAKTAPAGSNSVGISDPGQGATAPLDLSAYCTATVTKDVVEKIMDRDWFTVKTGEKLTLLNYAWINSTKMLRFTKSGSAYEVSDLSSGDFTSDCSEGTEGAEELVALADINIYSDPDLTTKICSFSKGQAAVSQSFGQSLAKEMTDSDSYEVAGDAFNANCKTSSGKYYASFPKLKVNEITTTPILFAHLRKKV